MRSILGLGSLVVVLGMYLSIKIISVVMIYTGYKAITDINVVTLHIVQSAVVDSNVVRGVESTRRSRRTEYKVV